MNRMIHRSFAALFVAFLACATARAAAPTPAPAPTAAPAQSATETQFVASVTGDLQSRFATTDQASAAGYFRYTNEDQTGAISWVNLKYWQSDQAHPSQLWYDVKGRLIGADFSVLQSGSPARPAIWGVSPSRWLDFAPGHVHFGIKTATGVAFGGAGSKSMATVGGSLTDPTAADIVKLGTLPRYKKLGIPAAKSADDVAFVFPFPAIWDLQVWLVQNPLGAFAEHNPNVIPSAAATNQD
ncbi:MAG TPA: hypothetical protein VGX91_15070 [Candidatus Cybelea sp.]|nr:hypothetical protein [Candidatus Cybelea sp.]